MTRSDGWHRYEQPRPEWLALADDPKPADSETKRGAGAKPKAEAKGAATTPWNKEFEVVVNLEINHPEAQAGRYRRPYVAVWVEDKDGKSVRTLSLWVSMGGAGPFQWLPDLKRWYADDLERKRHDRTELLFTIARPTRQAGKYKIIWDGKDDHNKLLPAGEYTISIEAARARDLSEHSQAGHSFRQAVHRGTQGQCRDPIRLDRVSSKGSDKVANRRSIPWRTAAPGSADSISGSPS